MYKMRASCVRSSDGTAVQSTRVGDRSPMVAGQARIVLDWDAPVNPITIPNRRQVAADSTLVEDWLQFA